MGNWLSAEPGLSFVDTVQIPSGQRDDNCHGGEETEGKGRNQAVVSYNLHGFIKLPVNQLGVERTAPSRNTVLSNEIAQCHRRRSESLLIMGTITEVELRVENV